MLAQAPQPRQVMHVVAEQGDLDHAEVGDPVQEVADAALLGRGQGLQAVVELQQVGQQAPVGPVGPEPPGAAAGTGGTGPAWWMRFTTRAPSGMRSAASRPAK